MSVLYTDNVLYAPRQASSAGLTVYSQRGAVIFYEEGGENGPNRRNNLYDALALARATGASEVRVDGRSGQPTTEARTYDWANVSLGLALWTGGPFSLEVVDGTVFSNLEIVTGGLVLTNRATSPVMTVASGKSAEVHFTDGAQLLSASGCSAPFFKGLTGSVLILTLSALSTFDGQGIYEVAETDNTMIVVVNPNALAAAGLFGGTAVGANTLRGAGSIYVSRGIGSLIWAEVSASHANATGLLTITP